MIFLLLLFLLFCCHLWLTVRIWSAGNALWGIGTFIGVPFVPTIFLLLSWSEDNGVKTPYFATIILTLGLYMSIPSVGDMITPEIAQAMMEDPEHQQRMQTDPAYRAQFEEIMAQHGAEAADESGDDEDESFADDDDGDFEDGGVREPERAPVHVAPTYSDTEQRAWQLAMSNLPREQGRVSVPQAFATIDLPKNFRFIDGNRVGVALASVKETVDPDVAGWIVHQDTPLDDRYNAWWIEVRVIDAGHVALGNAGSGAVDEWKERAFEIASDEGKQSGKLLSFLGFPIAPWVDETGASAAVVASYGAGGDQAHLCTGLALGREKQVAFTMRAKYTEEWQELCALSVRTLARRTAFDASKGYADYTRFVDDRSQYDVVDYFIGAARVGKGL